MTRKQNEILPNFWKKVAKNLHQSLILKPSNIPWVEIACLGEIGQVKSSLNGEISPNLVALILLSFSELNFIPNGILKIYSSN